MHADSSAATVPTVTLGPSSPCAILILVVMVVSVNFAQEILIKLASIPDTTPTLEPMNAKVFASANKVSLSFQIFLSNNVYISSALFTLLILNPDQC